MVARIVIVATAFLAACGSDGQDYNPDWDTTGVVAGGKADGLFDDIPLVKIGDSVSGDVGGDRLELYRITLQRTDRVEITMTVTDGNLDPHIQFYYGTQTYVKSAKWARSGDALIKEYIADDAGTYLIAARAYKGKGEGDYTLTVKCLDGPCAGVLPPPTANLDADDVQGCIQSARRCAFSRLPRYNGAVGDARAALVWQECLGEAALSDGSSCSAVCEWVNPDDAVDSAAGVCNDIVKTLPFYADQSEACLAVVDSCMGECYDAAQYGGSFASGVLIYGAESMCWGGGFNGTCDGFARSHSACGGELLPNSAGECTAYCHSTQGVFIDDLDTLCGSDSDCDESCDVDIAAAAKSCGGLSEDHTDCIISWFDDHQAWVCEDGPLDYALLGVTPPVTCSYSASPLGDTSADLRAAGGTSTVYTASTVSQTPDITEHQIRRAVIHLDGIDEDAPLWEAFEGVDDGEITHTTFTLGGETYDWVQAYMGDTEVGVVYLDDTMAIVAEISDGDLLTCKSN